MREEVASLEAWCWAVNVFRIVLTARGSDSNQAEGLALLGPYKANGRKRSLIGLCA